MFLDDISDAGVSRMANSTLKRGVVRGDRCRGYCAAETVSNSDKRSEFTLRRPRIQSTQSTGWIGSRTVQTDQSVSRTWTRRPVHQARVNVP